MDHFLDFLPLRVGLFSVGGLVVFVSFIGFLLVGFGRALLLFIESLNDNQSTVPNWY
jgi:hypothetical protein